MLTFQQVIELKKVTTSKTVREAAEALGVSDQAISVWASKPNAPVRVTRGKTRLKWPDFPRWREEQLRSRERPADYDEAKTREMAAKAEIAELELAEKRGELVAKAVAMKGFARVLERMDAKLRGMVPLSVSRLWGAKTQADLQTRMAAMVEEVREELRAPSY